MNLLQLIESVIGTTYYTTVTSPDGFPIVIYSLPYVVASIMLLMAFWGVIKWLTMLAKRALTLGGRD